MADLILQNLQQQVSLFDAIRRFDASGNEYWLGRELMKLMGYAKWERFERPVEQASENLELNGDSVSEHSFPLEGSYKGQPMKDYKLSRYGCYMVALCCDGRKPEVAIAKKYFAVKAREAETIIPAQSERIRELELENENLRLKERLAGRLDAMLSLHGQALTLTLMGHGNCIVREETVVTEVVNQKTGTSIRFLSAEQVKREVAKRTGQKLKSLKVFTDEIRNAGRDDLLVAVERSQVTEYPIPEKFDEALAIVYGKSRQGLIGQGV